MKINTMLRSVVFGGLLDQAIVSFGNFALGVYLARKMPAAGYGAFSFILSVVVFLNTIHQAFVIYPLSVRGHCATRHELDLLWTTAVIATIAEAVVLVFVLTGAAATVGLIYLVPPAAAAMLLWQMQEVFRRGCLAQTRIRAAITSDSIRYAGVAATVVLFGGLGRLSLPIVFVLIAAASLAGSPTLVAAMFRRYRLRERNMAVEMSARLQMSAPVIGANILAAFSNQWFLWVLARMHGLPSSGALVALANVAAVTSPVMFGIENILVPEIARDRAMLPPGAMRRLLLRRGGTAGLLVGPFLGAVAIWPAQAVQLLYGQHTGFAQFTCGLRLLAASYALLLCSSVLGAALRGYSAGRPVFLMQLCPAVAGITIGTVLIRQYGVTGACMASLIAAALRTAIGFYFVMQIRELTACIPAAIVAAEIANGRSGSQFDALAGTH
jgi:O-antigen/teichoic acid export membrane protein